MDNSKALLLFLCLFIAVGIVTGFDSESPEFESPSYSSSPDSPGDEDTPDPDDPEEDNRTCWGVNEDGELIDSDDDDRTGIDDPGCVRPLWEDGIEGLIWESDISTTFEGEPSEPTSSSIERPAPYFSGSFTEMGNDLEQDRSEDSVQGNGEDIEYEHYYIWEEGSEDNDEWAFGIRNQTTITGFPEGSVVEDDRVVLPPNPDSDQTSDDDLIRCGDGIENDGDSDNPQGDDESNSPPDSNTEGYTTDCREDWGRIWERYDVSDRGSEDPWESSSQSGSTQTANSDLWCRDDNMDADGDDLNLECDDATDATCDDGDSSCGCGSASGSDGNDATCDSAEDWSGDEDNEYWIIDGDDIVRESCQGQTTETYATGSSGSDRTCDDYTAETDENGTCTGCSSDGTTTWDGGDSDSVSGTNRDWQEAERQDCSTHNSIDGGASSPNSFGGYENSDAGTFTSFTAYEDSSWGDDGRVWCGYDYTTTVNADGSYGYGNGFVVIYEGEIVATENPQGEDEVGQHTYIDEERQGSEQDQENLLSLVDADCGDKRACIKYVNFYTESSGWQDIGSSPGTDDLVSEGAVDVDTETVTPDESYSVCKNINRINKENGDERELVDCDYMRGGDNISPLSQACGDDENEQLMLMEGPQVDNSVTEEWLGHEQKCVNWEEDEPFFDVPNELDENACVLKGNATAEGTVANVASVGETSEPTTEGYEEGGDSPDWQVCLNIDHDNADKPYNHLYNDFDEEGFGGQWYDLDDERVNEYLRQNEGRLGLSTEQRVGTERYIDYYYGENPNPYHPDYNPKGGERGTSVIADCSRFIEGCGDDGGETRAGINAEAGFFFGFFEDRAMDDDFHPQGLNQIADLYPVFQGHINMIKSVSDQLSENHYDHGTYDPEWYEDTHADEDSAVQYAYTEDPAWVIDSTGVPYPPFGQSEIGYASSDTGIHYREEYDGSTRTDTTDDTVQKTARAFGNSLAVIAAQDITSGDIEDSNVEASLEPTTDNMGEEIYIQEGEGFWIDPDDIRKHWEAGHISSDSMSNVEDWRDLVTFDIDLTGPDSGLGWDYAEDSYETSYDPFDIEYRDSDRVVFTEITWRDGVDSLQPPMCGDDRNEFLIEEMGEAPHSEQYTGPYACTNSPDQCFVGDTQEFYDSDRGEESFTQTNERTEEVGRLKQDVEYCSQNPDGLGTWYDQDFRQGESSEEFCRENTLYGSDGKRWFDEDYVEEHPYAVTGGIDDSWNPYMEQNVDRFDEYEQYESQPDRDDLHEIDLVEEGVTPVPTGTDESYTASLGFCGGDDEGEHLVTQEANTDLAETNRDVMGVASSSDYCIFDGEESQYTPEDSSQQQRQLYEPGETIDFGGPGSISCYDGTWYDTWPIVFDEVSIEVPFENRRITGFSVINPDDVERTFEVEMSEEFSDSVYTFSEFREETGTSFDVTVPPQSSESFNVIIRGEDNRIENEDLVLTAESSDGEVSGEDSLEVTVSEDFDSDEVIQGEPESVSGIGFMQIAVLTLSALMFFFLQS